ncbi:MAG TPA: DoxX family protein [Thermoanaerobaculia bacterium]|nr:DoxX family protein [Thermoanaerobaculia bacterium]
MKKLMLTDDDVSRFLVRLFLGLVMFPHGAQKLLGWFGGSGYSGTMQFFTTQLGLPAIVVILVIVAEFFGALGLIVGFLSRVAAFGILCVMLGAMFMIHLEVGFFMNWYGSQQGEGYEYHLLAIGMALAVIIGGSGAFSVDRAITRNAR